MSRYYAPVPNYDHDGAKVEATLAYGFDSVAGYYYMLFVPQRDEPVASRDSLFGNLTHGRFLEQLETLQAILPDAHRQAIALDLPF